MRTFKRGSGCYTCISCGKQTRETGHGESDCELCAFCYHESGMENTHNDNGPDHEDKELCPTCNPQGHQDAICKAFQCLPPGVKL